MVGLTLYGHFHFGILLLLSAVNAFYAGKSFMAGICTALFLSIAWPNSAKTALRISAMLFVAFNVYAISRYDLRHLAWCLRAFYSTNALLSGMAITSGMLIGRQGEKTKGSENGHAEIAPGNEPLRM